jgi:hypothetical protein
VQLLKLEDAVGDLAEQRIVDGSQLMPLYQAGKQLREVLASLY